MAKVFIINDLHHNFNKASKFGELVNVTEGKVPIFKIEASVRMLEEGLAEFTDNDYLLVSGPAILCMLAAGVVRHKVKERLKALVFDAKEQDYVVRHIPV